MKCEDCGKVLSRNWGGKYCPSCTEKRRTHIDNDEQYQKIQRIYLDWHDGRRPLSGFVRAIEDELAAQRQALRDEVMGAVGDKIEDSGSSKAFVSGREYQQFVTRQAISTLFEGKK